MSLISFSLSIFWFGWRRALDKNICSMFILLVGLSAVTSVTGEETLPDPELLEMLGAMGDIENLGVDVDSMIGKQLDTKDDNEDQEP